MAADRPEIIDYPSPNFGNRPGGVRPRFVVLHYTAMETVKAALERLCDPAVEVSAHYVIGPDAAIYRLVDEKDRAWHAGVGSWRDEHDVNSHSIGIELANDGRSPFPEPQMAVLEGLLREIFERWSIGPEAVFGHSDMASTRKTDPGPRFDWRRLARSGLSVWPELIAPGVFRVDARAFGYPDVDDDTLLNAVRLRFRPWATGPLDDTDRAVAAGLARLGSVDPNTSNN